MTDAIAAALDTLEEATAVLHAAVLSGAALEDALSERQRALEELDILQPFWRTLPEEMAPAYLARLERLSLSGIVVMAELRKRKRMLIEELGRHEELRRTLLEAMPPAVIDQFA